MDNIFLNSEAKEKLVRGISKVADAVKVTLGAAGSNAILEEGLYPYHIITNDGVSVAQKIKLVDPVENIGRNIMVEVAERSNKESGDGTTTSMVLTQAILEEGLKSDAQPMDIKRSLDECVEMIMLNLDSQKKLIGPDEVGAVATISSESVEMGNMLQEIYQHVGKDGIVDLDVSNLPITTYEFTEGVRLRNCGFMYPYMTNDGKGRMATYKSPKVLITKQKIDAVNFEKPIKFMMDNGIAELVVFCDEIDSKLSEAFAVLHMQGKFKCLVIKAPTLWKDWLFEDFAEITGATIVNPATGLSLKNLGLNHLGSCAKITTSKNETVVVGIADISAHLLKLKEDNTDDSKLRIAWLQTKTAILKLGAGSESELSYVRLKAEDARNASYLALQDGVVAGGGVALMNVSKVMPNTVGGVILSEALKAPMKQICENAGYSWILWQGDSGEGYDAKSGTVVDMWEAKILDPVLVVKNAVRNAISIAGTVLTAKVVITQDHANQSKV